MGESKEITYREGPEVARIIRLLRESVQGENADTVLIATIAFSLIILNPEISQVELEAGIMGASDWMTTFTEAMDTPVMDDELPPNQVN